METAEKKALLDAAVAIGKLYAFLARTLRVIINPEINQGVSVDLLNSQLDILRTELEPILSKNHIVQKNIFEIDQWVTGIYQAAEQDISRDGAVENARTTLPIVEERARTVSDLVALLRRL